MGQVVWLVVKYNCVTGGETGVFGCAGRCCSVGGVLGSIRGYLHTGTAGTAVSACFKPVFPTFYSLYKQLFKAFAVAV